jgi:hypothetical protein
VARLHEFIQRQRAIPVAPQELEIARELVREHVVIIEDRYFRAPERQSQNEAGVPGPRDAGNPAGRPA